MKKYYQVEDNPFHGGKILSRHRSELAAARAIRHQDHGHSPDCACGGAVCWYYETDDAEPVKFRPYRLNDGRWIVVPA